MGCSYYGPDGKMNRFYTEIFGYLDNVPPEKRSVREFYEMLRDNGVVVQYKGSIRVKLGFDFKDQKYRLTKIDTIAAKFPGLISYRFVENTPGKFGTRPNKLHVVEINERVLKSIPTGDQRAADIEVSKEEDVDEAVLERLKINKQRKELLSEMSRLTRAEYELSEQALRDNKSQSRFSDLPDESKNIFTRKVNKLTQAFANVGIFVSIEYDYNLDAKAEVQPAESDSKVTIKVNPDLISEDTAYHEFGHIFIDMLGVENEVVKMGFEQLRDTDLYKKVAAQYPELSGVELDKEVLATAIGLEGAKITRKNPSKLQILVNRIIRAFGKFLNTLGLKVQPGAASQLAEEMFTGNLKLEKLGGKLSRYAQRSKGEENLLNLLNSVKVSIKAERLRVYKSPEYTSQQKKDKQEAVDRLLVLEQILKKVDSIEKFSSYVEFSAEYLSQMRQEYDAIIEYVEENPEAAKSTVIAARMYKLKRGMDSLDVLKTIRRMSSKSLRRGKNTAAVEDQLEDMTARIDMMLVELDDLESDFMEDIIPMMADALLGFSNTKVDEALQVQIDNIKRTGRYAGVINKRTIEYKELREKYKDPKSGMTESQYREALQQLAIDQLKNKMIAGRADMIRHLKQSYTDKSSMSVFWDPIIYDNERVFQHVVKLIDDRNQNRNQRLLDLKYRLDAEYRKFAEGKNENQISKLYSSLLETVTTKDRDGNTVKVLSIVQPIDVARYNTEKDAFYTALKKKWGFPVRKDAKSATEFQIMKKRWNKTGNAVRYLKEESEWIAKNTEPVEHAEEIRKDYDERIEYLVNAVKEAKEEGNEVAKVYYQNVLQRVKSLKKRDFNQITDRPQGNLVQPKQSVYENPKYTALMADPVAAEFYEWYVKNYFELQDLIGTRNMQAKEAWQKHSYQMPSIRKSTLDKTAEEGAVKAGKDLLLDSFTVQEATDEFAKYDSETGEIRKSIPIFYTGLVDRNIASKDMASSLYQFAHMAFNFVEKSEIIEQVELTKEILAQKDTDAVDSNGRRFLDSIADSLGIRRFQKKGGAKQRMNHLEGFLNSELYGEKEILYSMRGFNMNKIAGNLNQFVALTNLSFNMLQIGNQAVLDNLTALQEGFAGQFFSFADQTWALAEYAIHQKASLEDIGRFAPQNFLSKTLEFFDGLTEITDNEGKKLVGGQVRKLLQTDTLMFGQHAVEHQVASVKMLAVLKATKVKDENGDPIMVEGEEASLYDMLVVDEIGRMSIDPRVADADRLKKEITLLLRGLNRRTNQIKGSFDQSQLNRYWWGKLFGLFRGYLAPGLRRRYGHGDVVHVDEELGTLTQGTYITLQRLIMQAWDEKTINLPEIYADMTPMEQENIKRISMELSSIIAAGAMIIALGSIDDDEETWVNNFLLYQAKRYQTEMLQWVPGFGVKDILRMAESPTATARPISQGFKLLSQVLKEAGHLVGLPVEENDIFYERATARFEKGDRKINKYLQDLFPVIRGIEKSKNPADALKWFSK